ncbi:MAG: hypothetical protein K2X76_09875 [Sphingomonas sp.]|nr:hypothetical protein [Sphingomonas sp.]
MKARHFGWAALFAGGAALLWLKNAGDQKAIDAANAKRLAPPPTPSAADITVA